jgi:hypothetical protein
MSGPFFGVIEKVESSGIELSLRCIREYRHDDGLMLDDVWVWKFEEAQADAGAILKTIVGVPLLDFALRRGDSEPELVIYSDELAEPVSVRAKRIWKTEEPRSLLDLERLVGELSLQIRRADADYIAQSRKISE